MFYVAFTLIMLIIVFLMVYTPYLAFTGEDTANWLYNPGFSWACHQKISRSLCLFKDDSSNGNYFIADCTKQIGKYVPNDRTQIKVINDNGLTGYKIPVCARDVGIYAAMLIASIIYPFFRKLHDENVPAGIYLLLAMVPIGLDGGLQLLSEFGINIFGNYESTNIIRLITGVIAGFALPFYIFPLVNYYKNKKFDKKIKNDK